MEPMTWAWDRCTVLNEDGTRRCCKAAAHKGEQHLFATIVTLSDVVGLAEEAE